MAKTYKVIKVIAPKYNKTMKNRVRAAETSANTKSLKGRIFNIKCEG